MSSAELSTFHNLFNVVPIQKWTQTSATHKQDQTRASLAFLLLGFLTKGKYTFWLFFCCSLCCWYCTNPFAHLPSVHTHIYNKYNNKKKHQNKKRQGLATSCLYFHWLERFVYSSSPHVLCPPGSSTLAFYDVANLETKRESQPRSFCPVAITRFCVGCRINALETIETTVKCSTTVGAAMPSSDKKRFDGARISYSVWIVTRDACNIDRFNNGMVQFTTNERERKW